MAYPSAILRPHEAEQYYDYRSHDAGPLGDLISHFWSVTWDLPEGTSYTAQTLPYASVNLSVTNTEADVTGLTRRRYLRHLSGRGYAVAARFRPGCFRPFVGFAVSELTDRHRPIAEVLGRATTTLEADVAAEADVDRRVELLRRFLEQDWPDPDPIATMLAELVERVAVDRTITRVTQIAAEAEVTVRRLQRLFAEYVGAGPKWVIQRCRLQDAAARAAAGEPVRWAQLAVDLGFADQAHLTRAFVATIGTPPATYAQEAQAGSRP